MIQFLKNRLFGEGANNVKVIRDPMSILWQKILFVLVFILAIFVSFFSGKYLTSSIAFERDELIKENALLNSKLAQAKINIATAELNVESSQIAVEKVRSVNNELISQIADLERDVTYYQRVMNPIHNDKGLRIETAELEETSDENRFYLNLVLTQLSSKNKTVIKGLVQVVIEGSELGAKKQYKLEEIKLVDKDLVPKFRFRYYQEISEEFVLPSNFIPERIQVVAIATGSKSMRIEQIIDWPFE